MPFAPSSPITGATVTGLTNPTYTHTADTAPSNNGKQFAVTQLGGTQTNVEVNGVSKPFTLSFFRPQVLKVAPTPNPVTGLMKEVPMNTYKMIVRKGVLPGVNQSTKVANVTITIGVPAGSDGYEPEDLRAMISFAAGAFYAQADGISQTILTGVL